MRQWVVYLGSVYLPCNQWIHQKKKKTQGEIIERERGTESKGEGEGEREVEGEGEREAEGEGEGERERERERVRASRARLARESKIQETSRQSVRPRSSYVRQRWR